MFHLLLGQLICRGRGNSEVSCYLTTKVYKNHFRCETQCALCNEFSKVWLDIHIMKSVFFINHTYTFWKSFTKSTNRLNITISNENFSRINRCAIRILLIFAENVESSGIRCDESVIPQENCFGKMDKVKMLLFIFVFIKILISPRCQRINVNKDKILTKGNPAYQPGIISFHEIIISFPNQWIS